MALQARREGDEFVVKKRGVGKVVACREPTDDRRGARPEPYPHRNLVCNLQIETARLMPAGKRIQHRADDQVGTIGGDPLGVNALVGDGDFFVRPWGDVNVEVEVQRQGRAVERATQVGASRRDAHADPLGHGQACLRPSTNRSGH